MAKQTRRQAVERRTRLGGQAQQRLAARKEAAERGVETRRRNREAQLAELKKQEARLAAESKKARDAESASESQAKQPQAPKHQTKRPERNVAQKGRAGEAMATVALRGEQAKRLRALAAKHELTLSKLLVRMMEVFEGQAK